MLISSESDASCSFGSSEEDVEVEEECIDMEDDSDEDEGVIIFFHRNFLVLILSIPGMNNEYS